VVRVANSVTCVPLTSPVTPKNDDAPIAGLALAGNIPLNVQFPETRENFFKPPLVEVAPALPSSATYKVSMPATDGSRSAKKNACGEPPVGNPGRLVEVFDVVVGAPVPTVPKR
jgi:hypothetical protein